MSHWGLEGTFETLLSPLCRQGESSDITKIGYALREILGDPPLNDHVILGKLLELSQTEAAASIIK